MVYLVLCPLEDEKKNQLRHEQKHEGDEYGRFQFLKPKASRCGLPPTMVILRDEGENESADEEEGRHTKVKSKRPTMSITLPNESQNSVSP